MLRLQPDDLELLDLWIATNASGESRPEAMRRIMRLVAVRMPTTGSSFVIEDGNDKLLRDNDGELIVLANESEAEYFSEEMEHVRPFDAATDEVREA